MSFLGFKKKPTSSLHSHESSKQEGARHVGQPELSVCLTSLNQSLKYVPYYNALHANILRVTLGRLQSKGWSNEVHQLSRKKNRITHVQDHQELNLWMYLWQLKLHVRKQETKIYKLGHRPVSGFHAKSSACIESNLILRVGIAHSRCNKLLKPRFISF
jgi:hypothetical protein